MRKDPEWLPLSYQTLLLLPLPALRFLACSHPLLYFSDSLPFHASWPVGSHPLPSPFSSTFLPSVSFPAHYKHAMVSPILDSTFFLNYWSTSLLHLTSRLIECRSITVVWVFSNSILHPFLFNFCSFHATKTAFTKVSNKLFLARFQGLYSILITRDPFAVLTPSIIQSFLKPCLS